MSRVVGCAGTSHSPMLAVPPIPGWQLRAQSDESGKTELFDRDGVRCDYAALRERTGDRHAADLTPSVWEARYAACVAAISRLGRDIMDLAPDLLVIIGDDQEELFTLDNNPSIAIAYAPLIRSAHSESGGGEPSAFRSSMGMTGECYRADPAAALHLIEATIEQGFDIAAVRDVAPGVGFGHAFTWVLGRLLPGTAIPAVPVLLNTYYPPNQPMPRRCLELGRALRRACESLPDDRRVVIVASGGLSHFVVDADLDNKVLRAIEQHDSDALVGLPAAHLDSGTSEIRNWIVMSGASEGLTCRWVEYQPAYRTLAGTGCGLAFTILS